ncbi:hypothetical protein PMAYCL1PPCAC_16935, partial [Pristionchus mayeri]
VVRFIHQLEQLARLTRVLPPCEEERRARRLEHPSAVADGHGDALRLERLGDREYSSEADEVEIDAADGDNHDHRERAHLRAAFPVEVDAEDEAEEADAIEELVDLVVVLGARVLG